MWTNNKLCNIVVTDGNNQWHNINEIYYVRLYRSTSFLKAPRINEPGISRHHLTLGSCLVDIIIDWQIIKWHNHHHTHHNRFTALFPRPPGWASARRELLDFMVQRKIIEADTPTIRLGATPSGLTSAHLHHPSIFYGPDALPATQLTVSRHWRQLAHSD